MLVTLEWGFYIKFSEIFWKNLERECSFSYLYLGRIRKMLHSFRMHEAVFTKKNSLCFELFCTNTYFLKSVFCNLKSALWGCLCDSWKPSFLSLLIFNYRTFSRRVTGRWWCQWENNQVLTNQNSRNRLCQIVRRTISYCWKLFRFQ